MVDIDGTLTLLVKFTPKNVLLQYNFTTEHSISLFPLVGARSRYIESYWPVRFLYILYGCDIVDGVEILKMTICIGKKEAPAGGEPSISIHQPRNIWSLDFYNEDCENLSEAPPYRISENRSGFYRFR